MFSRSVFLSLALLCLTLAGVGEARAQTRKGTQPLRLTNDRPSGSFAVPGETLDSKPDVLTIELTSVANPSELALGFFVYLVDLQPGDGRKPIGNFALYPPDRPGKFLLKTSEAVRWHHAHANGADARLVIEMKRLDESKAWTKVEVEVASPQWTRSP